jgi:hypothetical protein
MQLDQAHPLGLSHFARRSHCEGSLFLTPRANVTIHGNWNSETISMEQAAALCGLLGPCVLLREQCLLGRGREVIRSCN